MFGREQRVLLRHYLEQGLTKTAIAEKLGVSRRTMYHWIKTGELDRHLDAEPVRYAPRTAVPWKLDPYKAIIDERLGQYPELSATRLFEEAPGRGLRGWLHPGGGVRAAGPPPARKSRLSATRRLRGARPRWTSPTSAFPGRIQRPCTRGWKRPSGPLVGCRGSCSSTSSRMRLEDRRMGGGELLKNEEFLRYWGFEVPACRPYRAQTKGKVEQPRGCLRGNFVYGREFASDADL